jgi:hypothetical protein
MTIDPAQSKQHSYPLKQPSHRTRPEQLVGLGIYLSISLGFEIMSRLTTNFLGTIYFISLALGMWTVWRQHSLRVLKLELSLFLAQFLFQMIWSISFYVFEQSLLALVALLLLWCNTLIATLLFWKKERISGLLSFFPLIWVFYLVGINMLACMSI